MARIIALWMLRVTAVLGDCCERDVFGFTLSEDELEAIDALDRGLRGGPDPDEVDPSTWGLEIPDV